MFVCHVAKASLARASERGVRVRETPERSCAPLVLLCVQRQTLRGRGEKNKYFFCSFLACVAPVS